MKESETLNKLSDLNRARMIRLRQTFETPGWTDIVAYFREQSEFALKRAASAESWDKARYAKGEMDAFLRICDYEAAAWSEMEALVTADEPAEEDDYDAPL